jgi:hypothetical protein
MLAALRALIRADIDRQLGWAKDEVWRQTRYGALTGALAAGAALAALGAIVVGLIALYFWLAALAGPYIALGIIGAGLLLLAFLLSGLALMQPRPLPAARPLLQITRPAALLGTLGPASDKRVAAAAPALRLATDAVHRGSRPALLGTLVLVAIVGLIAGRRI